MDMNISFDLSSEMHCVLDKYYKIIFINSTFAKTLQYSKEQLINQSILDFVSLEQKNVLESALANLEISQTTVIQSELLNKENDVLQLKIKAQKKDAEEIYLCATLQIFQDAPLARFRRFFDLSLLDLLMITDEKARIIYTNKGFSDTLGFAWKEINLKPLIEFVYIEDQQNVQAFIEDLQNDEGITKNIINRYLCKNGLFKWFSFRAIYTKGCIYAVAYDITENKIQEIQIQELFENTIKLNQQLEQQNKELTLSKNNLENTLEELEKRNFELDQFVYKISHDLRAPLSSILGLVNLAKIDKDEISLLRDYISKIENSTFKLDEFINSLLEYSQGGRADVVSTKVDFFQIINNSLDSLKFMKEFNNLKIFINIDENNNFYNDILRLHIIFNNIISNTIKYQKQHNTEESYLKIDVHITPNAEAIIIFKDNGIGIPEVISKNVFNMFFRGTELSIGAGLGLYIVKQTVAKLGGKINLESQENIGTEIKLFIPNIWQPTNID